MAMSTRRKRILSLVNISNETNLLFLPKYETTHGTSVTEQQIAIADGGSGAVYRNNPKKKCVSFKRRPWTTEEKEIILKEFKSLIKRGFLPGIEQCTKLLEEQVVFTGRKWTNVKFFVKNYL
ncbi:uncharacterized protein [Diabrotica undecimpunctata]|uniref:uncharacterized protein isoform X2 n=1 Tax=Diabrotica undecimpunctata TaxID=50387 RepID=UPI003B63EA37